TRRAARDGGPYGSCVSCRGRPPWRPGITVTYAVLKQPLNELKRHCEPRGGGVGCKQGRCGPQGFEGERVRLRPGVNTRGLIDFLILLVVAGICGAIAQSIAGLSRGGCLVAIAVGFIGALIGMYL